MNTELRNNLMFIRLHAPRNLSQLKKFLPFILDIWGKNCKRGRYKSKWQQEKWVEELEWLTAEEELLAVINSLLGSKEEANFGIAPSTASYIRQQA